MPNSVDAKAAGGSDMRAYWEKFLTVLGTIFLIGIIPFLYFWTDRAGAKTLDLMAAEHGACLESGCSDAERAKFAQVIIDRTAYTSLRQLRWCLGVDGWSDTRVRRGGWLIGPMMDAGYLFCPGPEEK